MIVFDVEIAKAILGRNEPPIEGIEYCDGWRDFAGMGIACVCTYDIYTHLSRVFLAGDLVEFSEYVCDEPTAGFNTKRFDIPLLLQHGARVSTDNHYDILEHIWLALGLNPDKFVPATHGGWGLDAVCRATLGIAKTGHGALAPVWWQQKKYGKVIDYCLNDVWMEAKLLRHCITDGVVTNGKESIRVGPVPRAVPAPTAPLQYAQQQGMAGQLINSAAYGLGLANNPLRGPQYGGVIGTDADEASEGGGP